MIQPSSRSEDPEGTPYLTGSIEIVARTAMFVDIASPKNKQDHVDGWPPMTTMRGDVLNRVKRLPKPSKVAEALQPIFEAVSNAAHAVEDRFKEAANERGRIDVSISHLRNHNRFDAVISDNGIGLTPKRFEAFCTTDTDFKMERGGKGVGRLLWLDAFEKIAIKSVFEEDAATWRRSFRFQLDANDQIIEETLEKIDASESGTAIVFKGVRGPAYQKRFPSQAASVIRHFGSHFFADFILGRSPTITVSVDGATASFPEDVRDLLIQDRGVQEIESEEFGILSLANFICKKEASADFDGTHQLHFVANGRTVVTRKIDGLLGIGRFGDDDKHIFHGCVSGSFLDERVNQERTNFNFEERVADEIAKLCAAHARAHALKTEIDTFDGGRLKTMRLSFRNTHPSSSKMLPTC